METEKSAKQQKKRLRNKGPRDEYKKEEEEENLLWPHWPKPALRRFHLEADFHFLKAKRYVVVLFAQMDL